MRKRAKKNEWNELDIIITNWLFERKEEAFLKGKTLIVTEKNEEEY